MAFFRSVTSLLLVISFLTGCRQQNKENVPEPTAPAAQEDTVQVKQDAADTAEEGDAFVLTEENAIDFFYDYQQGLKANKVRITTSKGSFTVQLYDNVP